jgi:hypothetical protein
MRALLLAILIVPLAAGCWDAGKDEDNSDWGSSSEVTAPPDPFGGESEADDDEPREEPPPAANSITFGGVVMSPSILVFGGVPLGGTSTEILTLTNSNSEEATVTTANIDSERFVVVDVDLLPVTLEVDETAEIVLVYTPSRMVEQDGLLNIGVAGQVGYAEIGLLGWGTDEDVPSSTDTGDEAGTGLLEADPSSLIFEAIPALTSSTDTIELTNTGDGDITITDITSTHASIFSAQTDPLVPITLTAGASVDLDVTFSPSSETNYEALIDVQTDVLGADIQIPVSGIGEAPDCEVCAPRLEVMSSSGTSTALDMVPLFGLGCTANGALTLNNTGDMDLNITAVNVSNDWIFTWGTFSATWAGPLTISPGGNAIVAIDYVTTEPALESADLATDQNIAHILSNDPSRLDWTIELSATALSCGR